MGRSLPRSISRPAWHWIAEIWRVHFHVPVDIDRLGPLGTTRAELVRAVAALDRLAYRPHLEVETYTWPVLPTGTPGDLNAGLARELVATLAVLEGRA